MPQAKSFEAISFALFMLLVQFCYTAIAEAMSFLHSSCSHLQVQTVPSSTWDAPCPVVTPSCIYRLGSALSAINDNYVLFSLQSRLRSVSTAEALRHSCLIAVMSPSMMADCSSSTMAERSASISSRASELTGSE